MPKLDRRREIIERLLDHLPDYEPAVVNNMLSGERGSGGEGVMLMPDIYNELPVRELRRCLYQLGETISLEIAGRGAVSGRSVHAHLLAFYRSEYRIVRPKPKRRVLRGRTEWIAPPAGAGSRERVVSAWIVLPLVTRGVDFVVDEFQGEPFLPPQLLEAA